jgi:hypothetical protein
LIISIIIKVEEKADREVFRSK